MKTRKNDRLIKYVFLFFDFEDFFSTLQFIITELELSIRNYYFLFQFGMKFYSRLLFLNFSSFFENKYFYS